MCYDVATMTKKALDYAKRYGKQEDWEDIKKRLPPTYHVSGFTEPSLPVITNQDPDKVQIFSWPFIPMAYSKLNTLNCRDDNMFKSFTYKDSARNRRCLIMIDGFFDFHHKGGVSYPYFVQMQDGNPFTVGGIWQNFKKDGIERNTVSIVTTRANKEMTWLHNEPAYSAESRMMLVITKETESEWLDGEWESLADRVIKPLPDDALKYHPCEPIKPNKKLNRVYIGNVPEIQNYHYYSELEESQGSLF